MTEGSLSTTRLGAADLSSYSSNAIWDLSFTNVTLWELTHWVTAYARTCDQEICDLKVQQIHSGPPMGICGSLNFPKLRHAKQGAVRLWLDAHFLFKNF